MFAFVVEVAKDIFLALSMSAMLAIIFALIALSISPDCRWLAGLLLSTALHN